MRWREFHLHTKRPRKADLFAAPTHVVHPPACFPPQGGYTTPQQVSRSWLLSMTEWATQGLAGTPGALLRGNK